MRKQNSYGFGMDTAKIMEVIAIQVHWTNPDRRVVLFFDKEGGLLAINDPEHQHERFIHDQAMGM